MAPNGDRTKAIFVIPIVFFVILIISIGYLWPEAHQKDEYEIVLYGFSVKGEVFDEKIIPAFRNYWEEKTGNKIGFKTLYAGSGKITKQVITGAPAEVMVLSTEWDAIQLEKNGLVTTDWNTFPYNGTVSKSPWVILTRAGNPKGISDFADLTKSGTQLVHADPLTSGGACWSVFAVYGSELIKTEVYEGLPNTSSAKALLKGIINNVISWQSSARNALSQFTLGYGDALITYENEALLSKAQGEDFEIVYPKCTIYSEHKVVMVDKNLNKRETETVGEFIDFLYEPEMQAHLTDYGFRSVDEEINKQHVEFQDIILPFTVEYLGGWVEAHKEIIEGIFDELKG